MHLGDHIINSTQRRVIFIWLGIDVISIALQNGVYHMHCGHQVQDSVDLFRPPGPNFDVYVSDIVFEFFVTLNPVDDAHIVCAESFRSVEILLLRVLTGCGRIRQHKHEKAVRTHEFCRAAGDVASVEEPIVLQTDYPGQESLQVLR